MDKEQRVYLLHIRDCCERILRYAEFEQGGVPDSMVLDAICRNIEIIGEASRKIDSAFRAAHPEIPWRLMSDMRNFLIHAYEGVKPRVVRDVADRDIPELLIAVRRLLGEV